MADLQTVNYLLVRCNASHTFMIYAHRHYAHFDHKTSSSYQTHIRLSMYTSSSPSLLCSHTPYQYTPKHTKTTILCFLIRHSITTPTKDRLANQTTLFHANKTTLVRLVGPASLLAARPIAEHANTQEQMTTAFSPKQKSSGYQEVAYD